MNRNEDASFVLACTLFACIGIFCGAKVMEAKMKAQAIEANAAHYDSKTGEFVWGGR